jgi:hypothetical protein
VPDPAKLERWWGDAKLEDDQYEIYITKCGIGCARRLADLDAKRKRTAELAERAAVAEADAKRRKILATLAAIRRPFKPFAVLDQWRAQYHTIDFRYRFLIIVGITRSGKTQLAKSLYSNPFTDVVEDALLPCLDGLRLVGDGRHDAVVFDNVNTTEFVLRSRALFQASADTVILGKSATGMYAKAYMLHQVPMICTIDRQALPGRTAAPRATLRRGSGLALVPPPAVRPGPPPAPPPAGVGAAPSPP